MLSRRRVFVLLLLTSLLLISVDRTGNRLTDGARSVFARVVGPFDTAAEVISEPIARAWYAITNYDELQRENEALRDQIEFQKGVEIEGLLSADLYAQLLQLTQLTSADNYDSVPAQVVGQAPSNFQNTVEIGHGADRGIRVGMPVTSGAGLVGKISEVYASSSVVQLITDPQYNMGAEVLSAAGVDDDEDEDETETSITTPSGAPVGGDPTTTTSTSTTTTTVPADDPTEIDDDVSSSSAPPDSSTSSTTTTIAVEVKRETGTIEGQGSDEPLVLRFIDDTSAFTGAQVGDAVGTSGGIDSLSPQGIPIGTISRIVQQTGNRSPLIEVEINADLDELNFVAVVLFVPNQTAIAGR